MQQPKPMGQPCDICGDIGFVSTIVTCSRCRKSREHIYCMQPTSTSFQNHGIVKHVYVPRWTIAILLDREEIVKQKHAICQRHAQRGCGV